MRDRRRILRHRPALHRLQSRIIVTEGIHDRFVEALAEKARSLRVGDALDPQSQIGPAVSEQQLEQNLRYVKIAQDDGGKILTGGAEPLKLDKRGWYMTPTVISDTQPQHADQLRGSVRPRRKHGSRSRL